MSDFETDYNDDWGPIEAAYEENPTQTTAYLANAYAQQAAAQYAADPSAIATEAMVQMAQLQQNAEYEAQANAEAKLLDRSLSAKWQGDWPTLAEGVARRLATDSELQEKWAGFDTQQKADALDSIASELSQKERTKVFREIQGAGSNKLGL